jgi:hypothetical protein
MHAIRYGMRAVMSLDEEDGNIIEVFLQKRYGYAVEDTDITDILTKRLQYYLTYKGKSSASQALILQIELRCVPLSLTVKHHAH